MFGHPNSSNDNLIRRLGQASGGFQSQSGTASPFARVFRKPSSQAKLKALPGYKPKPHYFA